MKKILTILLLCSSVSFGQGIGVKIGGSLNYPVIKVDNNAYQNDNSLGGFLGISYTKNLKKIDIQTELLANTYFGKGESNFNITSVHLPILAQFKVKKIKVELGPQIDFLTNYKERETSLNPYFKKIGFSGIIGLQYLLKENIAIGLRYQQALAGFSSTTSLPGYKSVLLEKGLMLGIQYNFTKKNIN